MHTIPLCQRFPFASNVPSVDLDGEKILVNDVIFPGEFNPHTVTLYVVGDISGALGAVWADCDQDAWDEAADAGMLDHLQVEENEEEDNEDFMRLGNASECFDIDQAWMAKIDWKKAEQKLIIALAEARGAHDETLA